MEMNHAHSLSWHVGVPSEQRHDFRFDAPKKPLSLLWKGCAKDASADRGRGSAKPANQTLCRPF